MSRSLSAYEFAIKLDRQTHSNTEYIQKNFIKERETNHVIVYRRYLGTVNCKLLKETMKMYLLAVSILR